MQLSKDIEIYNNDARSMGFLQEDSIDLIVTSPPYNMDIQYTSNDDNLEYQDYLKFSKLWLQEALRVTKSDGRMCLNVALDKNKNGRKPIYSDLLQCALSVGWN